jgi:hypothetical protein
MSRPYVVFACASASHTIFLASHVASHVAPDAPTWYGQYGSAGVGAATYVVSAGTTRYVGSLGTRYVVSLGPLGPLISLGQVPLVALGQVPLVSLGQVPLVALGQVPLVALGQVPLVSLGQVPLVSLGQVPLVSLGQVPLVSLSGAVPLVSGTAEGTSRVSDVTAAGPDLAEEAPRRGKPLGFDAEFVGTPAPLLVLEIAGTTAPFVGTSVPLLALDIIGGTLVPLLTLAVVDTPAPAPPMRTYAAATTPMPPRSKGSALDSSGINAFFTSEPCQFFLHVSAQNDAACLSRTSSAESARSYTSTLPI